MPRWNAALGVWEGNRAAGTAAVPHPLYVFGYGSLCWKVDFATASQFVGTVRGWTRFFCQRSTDHRGTPDAPGLVASVLSDDDLQSLELREAGAPPSSCCGVCYRVADEDAATVLDALDFREKGGYTREIVEVTPIDRSEPVQALLYTATPDNPNFERSALTDAAAAAAVIARAHGPSGANSEYLFGLAKFLSSVGVVDAHVENLCTLTAAAQSASGAAGTT